MIIGFSGHQKLENPERWGWVRDQLMKLLGAHQPADTRILVALADGGDQMFTECAIAYGMAVDVVLPCSLYEETFKTPDAKAKYRSLLAQSANVETLEFVEPSQDAFLAAGKYVVDRCDLLVTLWNGKAAAGKGGTGDIVAYARALGKPMVHIHPDLLQVIGPN